MELIKIKNLNKTYTVQNNFATSNKQQKSIKALNNVNLEIKKGEILGLVGESGCGKSTLGKSILKLIDSQGEIYYENKNIQNFKNDNLKDFRKKAQMIFQNPYSSLDPRMTVFKILREPLVVHGIRDKQEINNRIEEIIELTGLNLSDLTRYPHEFSGGQRQRIAIARALVLKPEFLVADEPVSALDVSIQAQIITLLNDLKDKLNLTILFISHDLGVVKYLSDRIAVMYLGDIVELAYSQDLFNTPKHPYTQALIASVPSIHIQKKQGIKIYGDLPSPKNPPVACKFHTRCPYAMDICSTKEPTNTLLENYHYVKCHLCN